MAWKTKDVDAKFAESNWILYTVFVQMQILLVGFPVVFLLDGSANVVIYLANTMLVWLISVTTMVLMIVPKILKKFEKKDKKKHNRGSAGGGVHVTGIGSTQTGSNVQGYSTTTSAAVDRDSTVLPNGTDNNSAVMSTKPPARKVSSIPGAPRRSESLARQSSGGADPMMKEDRRGSFRDGENGPRFS